VKPRVGIDAHFLSRLEGNRSYVLALLRALARSGAAERFEISVYALDPSSDAEAVGENPFRWERLPRSSLLRFALGVRHVQKRDRLDVWHATFVSPGGRARLVLAVHDALALARPELLPKTTAAKLKLLLPRSIERARIVLVPTVSVKRDLDRLALGERARVAPIGIDTSVFFPAGGAPKDFVLAVGRADRRKRLPLLLRAVERARPSAGKLVLAGPVDPARFAGPNVTVVPSPDERSLADLYREARALVYPSVGEGLGLPVLEAFACGTPVIASDIEPVREVAGEAALALVPVDDEEALARAVTKAFELSPDERERLARLGRERALPYSLEAMSSAVEKAWLEALS
jgi:glycosyltransferase involved in cell wall biosynthesis